MLFITEELLQEAWNELLTIKTTEEMGNFLDNYRESQPHFLAFMNGSFKRLFSEESYTLLIHSTGQMFYMIKKSNPTLPEISQENIRAVFDDNMKVGVYIQKSEKPEETLIYIAQNHKYPILMKKSLQYSAILATHSSKEIAMLGFLIIKMLVEACDKAME